MKSRPGHDGVAITAMPREAGEPRSHVGRARGEPAVFFWAPRAGDDGEVRWSPRICGVLPERRRNDRNSRVRRGRVLVHDGISALGEGGS